MLGGVDLCDGVVVWWWEGGLEASISPVCNYHPLSPVNTTEVSGESTLLLSLYNILSSHSYNITYIAFLLSLIISSSIPSHLTSVETSYFISIPWRYCWWYSSKFHNNQQPK